MTRWSPEAERDLANVVAFIASDSPSAARRTGQRLLAPAERLELFARSGRPLPALQRLLGIECRELIVGNYRLAYGILENELVVLAVVHGARDWPGTSPA